jgi:hypothetical protein
MAYNEGSHFLVTRVHLVAEGAHDEEDDGGHYSAGDADQHPRDDLVLLTSLTVVAFLGDALRRHVHFVAVQIGLDKE